MDACGKLIAIPNSGYVSRIYIPVFEYVVKQSAIIIFKFVSKLYVTIYEYYVCNVLAKFLDIYPELILVPISEYVAKILRSIKLEDIYVSNSQSKLLDVYPVLIFILISRYVSRILVQISGYVDRVSVLISKFVAKIVNNSICYCVCKLYVCICCTFWILFCLNFGYVSRKLSTPISDMYISEFIKMYPESVSILISGYASKIFTT